jgi:hypothetical protein
LLLPSAASGKKLRRDAKTRPTSWCQTLGLGGARALADPSRQPNLSSWATASEAAQREVAVAVPVAVTEKSARPPEFCDNPAVDA